MQSSVADINLVAEFLANSQIEDLRTCPPVDCIVICGSAIIHQAEVLFDVLEARPTLAKTVVLCGGIGHSTPLLYDTIGRHMKFKDLYKEISGLPEARVMDIILHKYFDYDKITSEGCRVLVEDQSTNCGSNAIEAIKLLRASGLPDPETCMVIQDPTMSLRTLAGFRKLFENHPFPPKFSCCPIFVPHVVASGTNFEYDIPNIAPAEIWSKGRFISLLVGEIPRLRDDEHGYGPNGKGFIAHVDMPSAVEAAWANLGTSSGLQNR